VAQGGETPIADSRKVFERIDPKIKEQFIQDHVCPKLWEGLDLQWEMSFRQVTNQRSKLIAVTLA